MDVLVSRYHGKLLDLAMRHLRDRESSADVAQTALVRVFQSAASFRGQSTFRTWLYAIALNLIREEARRRGRRGELPLTDVAEDGEPADEEQSVEDAALGKVESVALWRAVEGLSQQHRGAVVLKFRMGLTYDEIAEVMDAPSGTVKSWIHHALKALRKSLANLSC